MIDIKIDTKEKFTVITPKFQNLTANIAANFATEIVQFSENPPHNIILNASDILEVEDAAFDTLAEIRSTLFEQNRSFVICCLTAPVLQKVKAAELEEVLNITPTESEAWDIVQMDEIEREFFADEGIE